MRETQPERVPATRDETYRTNVGIPNMTVERRVDILAADTNRLLQDIAIRLQRVENRLAELEKERST